MNNPEQGGVLSAEYLFDDDESTCYEWRNNINYWIYLNYTTADYNSAKVETIKQDMTKNTDISLECFEQDILQLYYQGTYISDCWDGNAWVSFGDGFGYGNAGLCEISLFYELIGTVPNEPILIGPEHDSVGQLHDVDLQVLVTDDNYDELEVSFYDEENLFIGSTLVNSGSVATVSWNDLDPSTFYSWYVVVENEDNSIISESWGFVTDMLPLEFTVITPLDGSENILTNDVVLRINVKNLTLGPSFIFYNAITNEEFTCSVGGKRFDDYVQMTCALDDLIESTKYYWHVQVDDFYNPSVDSPNWSFTTFGTTQEINDTNKTEPGIPEPEPEPDPEPYNPGGNSGNTGGGAREINTYKKFSNLNTGVSKSFLFDGDRYYFTVESVYVDYAELSIGGKTGKFFENDSMIFDLNKDGVDDFTVILNKIINKRVYATIEVIGYQPDAENNIVSSAIDNVDTSITGDIEATGIMYSEPELGVLEDKSDTSNLITGAAVGFLGEIDSITWRAISMVTAVSIVYLFSMNKWKILKAILKKIFLK